MKVNVVNFSFGTKKCGFKFVRYSINVTVISMSLILVDIKCKLPAL